ncbi:hypothetical protein K7472_05035 [Streptomyces sp. PTM05]|uniref:Abortive infection protein n=1 Tax=Streptantibioticus parmotrematis TaxID=2873249 RepID=A0ABS7QLZ0_9ACTN|nr:hypothetical protein [Streptantibioticus parmotrematis]MBY8884210.1 hypothetical protein [Streptantibioticus parmotrematis]
MRGKGINYDTGFRPGGELSRTDFDPDVVAEEMRVIASDLHCTAVRISGGDPERLTAAAQHAAAVGLQVWFAPFPCELTADELRPFFADCARRAEEIRRGGADVVLVTGCELSLFAAGFLPGATVYDRIAALTTNNPRDWAEFGGLPGRMNAFLADVVADARQRFGGPITYAAGTWEDVDWGPFDIVAADAYRGGHNADRFRDEVRAMFRHGKPVAVTEFGCCGYRGAGERGGTGWMIVDRGTEPPSLTGDPVRDEDEQVRYFQEVLEVFEREGVEAAFWFTFAGFELPHVADDPLHDLDMASYGVVKVLPGGLRGTTHPSMAWEPKKVFHALAAAYGG